MYNIDFTGGTLVTIRLNETDPTVQSLSESKRAEFVRSKATSVLPDVTVESLRVAKDASLTRFNIRTTEQEANKVKEKILEAFGPTLAKVEMKVGAEKPIAGAPAAEASKGAAALTTRFAGGREYPLSFKTAAFNSIQAPDKVVSAEFAKVLEAAGIANPSARFEILNAAEGATGETGAAATTNLVLRTDLEPDLAQAQLGKLAESLASNRDLLFERITNFGGTVAGETRTLALIATVASWVIIIVYLWWRFHSFTYGLAAVLAVSTTCSSPWVRSPSATGWRRSRSSTLF